MGGKNPELRTLYYRLLRLLSLFIQPLFVFDGPDKPPFKRGVRTNPNAAAASAYFSQNTKELIALFGFPIHQAPGEAEAECALLQQSGIVDAVLSEDVDTLMFGCTMHLRNWSPASTKGKVPTHVDLYRAEVTQDRSGLDREGMILVAMMSGGDYLPGGVEGCGIKTACQAARAGFGRQLCEAFGNGGQRVDLWRDDLQHNLETNEAGFFSRTNKSLKIPNNFPDEVVLGYYMSPATSSLEELEHIAHNLQWNNAIKVPQLRLFVAEMFDWGTLYGAKKFIRGLAPALLVHRLQARANITLDDLALQELEEKRIIKMIYQRRHHFETDATAELRVDFLPCDIVTLDLAEERETVKNVDHQPDTDSGAEEHGYESDQPDILQSPRKPRTTAPYDPNQLQKIWLIESFVKIGVPLLAENWEEQMKQTKQNETRKPKEVKATPRKPKPKPKNADGGMKRGALDGFVKIGKAGVPRPPVKPTKESPPTGVQGNDNRNKEGPSISVDGKTQPKENNGGPTGTAIRQKAVSKKVAHAGTAKVTARKSIRADSSDNPWTKSMRPLDTFNVKLPTGARYSALGIYGPDDSLHSSQESDANAESVTSSVSCSKSPSTTRKHARPVSVSSRDEAKRKGSGQKPDADPDSATARNEVISLDTADESECVGAERSMFGSEVYASQQTRTPAAGQKRHQGSSTIKEKEQNLSAQRVNRMLNFDHSSPPITPSSDSDSLPSPSTLFSPKAAQRTRRSSISPSPQKKPKGWVLIRDSLPGAWRDVGPEEAAKRPNKVMSSVDIVDLT